RAGGWRVPRGGRPPPRRRQQRPPPPPRGRPRGARHPPPPPRSTPGGPMSLDLDALDFAKDGGAVTVIAQDVESGAVLMVARADREALERTLATGEMHYRSRTRGLWHKGATSG